MARFSFGVFGQGSGDLQPDLHVAMKQSTVVKASTTPSGTELTVTDNGDGTYYVDALPSGNYDIYVAGALQDEMTNQLVLQEDIVTHQADATKHRLIVDSGTGATAGDGLTTILWSANQIHDWVLNNYEPKDTALLKEGEVDGVSLQFATTLKVKDGGITEAKLGSGAVTAGKIGTDAVTNAKMADNSVNTDELVINSVTSTKIIDGAIVRDKIADNAINPDKIAHHNTYGVLQFDATGTPTFASLTANHIQSNAITADKIGNNAVTTDKIINLAVTEGKIGASAITSSKIASDAVIAGGLAPNAVTTAKINNGAVTADKIGSGAVTSTKIADSSVTLAKLGSDVTVTVADSTLLGVKMSKVTGVGAQSGGSNWSGGQSPAFQSIGDADKIRYDSMIFKSDDFDTGTSLNNGNNAIQQIKIKQVFSSENYISSSKTLNQNLDILDQRLGYLTQFSGTEGLYMSLASGSWNYNASRDGNGTPVVSGSAVMDKPRITDGTQVSQTWYAIAMTTIYKIPDIRQLALYARGLVSNTGSGQFNGYTRIRIEGDSFSQVSTDSGAFNTTAGTTIKAVYKDMTSLQNYKAYNIWVDYKFTNNSSSGTKYFEIQDWNLVAKRQITAIAGDTDGSIDSPL